MKNGTGGYWSNFDMIVAFCRDYSITFIVNSKFHNLLLLEGKCFTSYYLTTHVVLFIQQSPEQTETCSAVFGNFR